MNHLNPRAAKRLTLLAAISVLAWPCDGQEKAPAQATHAIQQLPSDAESLGKVLCAQLDLGSPGLEEVRRLAAVGRRYICPCVGKYQ